MYANVTFPLTLVSNKLNAPFSPHYFSGVKIGTAFNCTFVETVPKLSVNFGNRNSQDSQKNQSHGPVVNFSFTELYYQCDHLIHALVGGLFNMIE